MVTQNELEHITFRTKFLQRIDDVIEATGIKFRDRSHFINIALEGYLKICEEKIKTKRYEK